MNPQTLVTGIIAAIVSAIIAWSVVAPPTRIVLYDDVESVEAESDPIGDPPPFNALYTGVFNTDAYLKLEGKLEGYEFELALSDEESFHVKLDGFSDTSGGTLRVSGDVKAEFYGHVYLELSENRVGGYMQVDDQIFQFVEGNGPEPKIVSVAQERLPRESDPRAAHAEVSFSRIFTNGVAIGPPPVRSSNSNSSGIGTADWRPPIPQVGVLVLQTGDDADGDGQAECEPTDEDPTQGELQSALNKAFGGAVNAKVTLQCISKQVLVGSNGQPVTTMGAARRMLRDSEVIFNMRRDMLADLVVLLVNNSADSCGYAVYPDYPHHQISDTTILPNPDLPPGVFAYQKWSRFFAYNAAFAVVRKNCAINNHSFAHEIGHLFGMHHDRFSEFGGVDANHGYGYPVLRCGRPVGRSIMSYSGYCSLRGVREGDCPRTGLFSFAKTSDYDPGSNSNQWGGDWEIDDRHTFGKPRGATGDHHLDKEATDFDRLKDSAPFVARYAQLLDMGPPTDNTNPT